MIRYLKIFCIFLLPLLACGCWSSAGHDAGKVILEIVKHKIRVGMHSADVVAALGSPDMVTRSASGNETWVYDKVHSESEAKTFFKKNRARRASAYSERTLTVIIHFDENSQIKDFFYLSSKTRTS